MGIRNRAKLYKELEAHRKRPLIVYVTSPRLKAEGCMSSDAIPEIHLQLESLSPGTESLDLLLVSHGGDPTVAWRIVSLFRERVEKFNVLVPQAAYSAATLVALGADSIVMHPNGNLGPTDPQVSAPGPGGPGGSGDDISFGSEDLAAFLRFAKDEVGLTDQAQLGKAFGKFSDAVGAVGVGVAARGAQLSLSMGEKLLLLHMTDDSEKQKAKTIAETLTKDFFHHGYPVSRTEAKNIGLPIIEDDKAESLIWEIWQDIARELQVREPFLALKVLQSTKEAAPLFSPVPHLMIPANLPQPLSEQVIQQFLAQVTTVEVPPIPYMTTHALTESPRLASRFLVRGQFLAMRLPDLKIHIAKAMLDQGWKTRPI